MLRSNDELEPPYEVGCLGLWKWWPESRRCVKRSSGGPGGRRGWGVLSELVRFLWSGMTCSPSKLASREMSPEGAGVLLPVWLDKAGSPRCHVGSEDFIPLKAARSASLSPGACQGCTLPSSSWPWSPGYELGS